MYLCREMIIQNCNTLYPSLIGRGFVKSVQSILICEQFQSILKSSQNVHWKTLTNLLSPPPTNPLHPQAPCKYILSNSMPIHVLMWTKGFILSWQWISISTVFYIHHRGIPFNVESEYHPGLASYPNIFFIHYTHMYGILIFTWKIGDCADSKYYQLYYSSKYQVKWSIPFILSQTFPSFSSVNGW